MVLANPAGIEGLEARTLAVTADGERLEPYSTAFLKVVVPGTPREEPAGVYNSLIRPIEDYIHIPEIMAWKFEMDALSKTLESKRVPAQPR